MKPFTLHLLAPAALFCVALSGCASVPVQSEAIAPIPVPGSVGEYTLKGSNASLESVARYVTGSPACLDSALLASSRTIPTAIVQRRRATRVLCRS